MVRVGPNAEPFPRDSFVLFERIADETQRRFKAAKFGFDRVDAHEALRNPEALCSEKHGRADGDTGSNGDST